MMQPVDNNNAGESKNKVQSIGFGHYNIYLIETKSGHILVDTGMPDIGQKLDEEFKHAGVDPSSVKLIIATHGHLDHIGSIAYAQKATGGKVLCHRSFADQLMEGQAEPAVPRNLMGRLLNLISGSSFDGVGPDILIDDIYDLSEHGAAGKIIHTPGHSPSSICIILDNGEALVGDMVREERSGKIGLGMFYEDKQTLLESIERVAAFEPRIIYLSHGTTIDNSALRDVIGTA